MFKFKITVNILPGGWGAGAGVSGATVVPVLLLPQDTAYSKEKEYYVCSIY